VNFGRHQEEPTAFLVGLSANSTAQTSVKVQPCIPVIGCFESHYKFGMNS